MNLYPIKKVNIETQFHKAFKLQGKSFDSSEELIEFSETISVGIGDFLNKWFNDVPYIEVNTSGSTGNPKVIQLQKEHMIQSAKATGAFFNLFENTTALLCMSPNYIAGKMMLVRTLTLGWQLDVIEPTSNPLEYTSKAYDFAAMVPLQLHNSLTKIHKIKKLIVGGGVVSTELLGEIQNIRTEVFATYGMTETITHIAVKKLNNFSNVFASEMKQSHYKTLPNITISKDSRGCLIINAPKIASERITTNDLVQLISETEFKWLGRFDSIINSGGIKLIPEQIEEKLATILKQRFFVAGISDSLLGEQLILIIEGVENDTILAEVKKLKTLSKFEIPKKSYFVTKFVETETRKINRKETLKVLAKNFN